MVSMNRSSFVCLPAALVTLVALGACSESPKPRPPAPPVTAPNAPAAPQSNANAAAPAVAPPGDPHAGLGIPPANPQGAPPVPAAPANTDSWKTSTATDDATKIEVAGLEMPKPTTWTWQQPTMQFRTLQYAVPAAGDSKDAAELVISLFMGADGGPIEGNITRWANQFRDAEGKAASPKVEEKEIDGMKVTLVELKGAYMAMGAPAPKEGTLQLGAIVRAEGRSVFIRLNGPEKTVEAERANWDKLIAGLKHATPAK